MAQKIILDTDIGDDIDDAYALALILASPELELVGVTTVFKLALARARQALTILKLAGREDIPVAAGCSHLISPRVDFMKPDLADGQISLQNSCDPMFNDVRPSQDATALPWEELHPLHDKHGVDFIIDTIMEGDGDIMIAPIGAMTNLAMALVKEPRIAAKIPRIVAMAACFDRHQSEWNIKCDPVAAAIVFNSGIPMTVTPLDVTTKCVLNQEQLDRLAASDRPIAKNLSAATKSWGHRFPTLHDPLAIETLIKPDIVGMTNGTVRVELSGDSTYGYTLFRESKDGSGPHDVCLTVDSNAACELWLERILSL